MRGLYSLLLVLLPLVAHAQVTIGEPIPNTEQVEGAKKTLEASKPFTLNLDIGTFQIILPSKALQTIPLTWNNSNGTLVEFDFIAPGESHSVRGKLMGDTVEKLHKFKAQPFGWAVARGVLSGSSTLNLWKNGADPKVNPPDLATTAVITVSGKPIDPPGPGPLVEPVLTQAVRSAVMADKSNGKFDERWAKELAGMYDRASKMDLSKVTTATTMDTVLNEARKATGMPEYNVINTALRTLAQKEMYAALGIPLGTDGTISPDAMRLLKVKLGDLASALAVVVP